MERYTHVHCVCGSSELEYASSLNDFILRPRLEGGGQQVFSSLQGGNRKFLKQLRGEQIFFIVCFKVQQPPPIGNK